MNPSSLRTLVGPLALLLATLSSTVACRSVALDPVVTGDGGSTGADGGALVDGATPPPAARCSPGGLGPAGGEVVLCGFGPDIGVAAATEDAIVLVERDAEQVTVSRIVLATGVASKLAVWLRRPDEEVPDDYFDANDMIDTDGESVVVPGNGTGNVVPISPGATKDVRDLVNFGRSVLDGVQYVAQSRYQNVGEVLARDVTTTVVSSLWRMSHRWNGTERVVGVGGGRVYVSLPESVGYAEESGPGRVLVRLPVDGGTPRLIARSDLVATGRNADIFRRSVVTLDGTAYYASDRGVLGRATLLGGPEPLSESDARDPFGIPESLRVADGYLYFMDRTSPTSPTSSLVRRVNLATRRMEPALDFGRAATAPAVVGQTLFTTIRRGGGLTPEEGVVVRKRF